MNLKRATLLTIALAALFLAACGDDDSDSDTAATDSGAATNEAPSEPAGKALDENALAPSGEAVRSAKVEIVGFEYAPATVTIQAGGKVTWLNQDFEEHTATLDDGGFSTGALAEGKLKSESFQTAGAYAYHCEIHPEMTGTVEVVEPS